MKTGCFRLGDYRVDPDRLAIAHGSEIATVEPKTMAVLVALAERAGEVVSADELIEQVWEGRALGDNPVYGAVAKLRRALGDDAREARFIETVPRRGYRLAVAPEA
ncbi:MAG: transcriptional regulator, partial [Thermoanaerobaculia bacterium]|nr:transcriptional regulator [Thermoanaerobaculia bacterium]